MSSSRVTDRAVPNIIIIGSLLSLCHFHGSQGLMLTMLDVCEQMLLFKTYNQIRHEVHVIYIGLFFFYKAQPSYSNQLLT